MCTMNEPLMRPDFRASPGRVPPRRSERADVSPSRGWRVVQIGALSVLATGALLGASCVSDDALDAAAVMALMQAESARTAHAPQAILHDPHFMQLTPIGLELVATHTRRAGMFGRIDEYDYRNAEGDVLTLLAASAPLAADAPHWSAMRVGDLRLLSWTVGGKRYVLAGHVRTHGLMRAADALTM
jgi:hypothetical protein